MFSKKWHPATARLEYKATFSIAKWKALSDENRSKHTLSSCEACYQIFQHLQEKFPVKPIFVPPTCTCTPIVTLPEQQSTSKTAEKQLARKVLTEINTQWEDTYAHSFTDALPRNVPDVNLAKKRSRVERKREERTRKRKLVEHINQQLAKNTTMSVLAEAESLASYNRKRLVRSFEKPEPTPKRAKSHSPNEHCMTWDVDTAMEELENFPANETINWSAMARRFQIIHRNGGQVLKETAQKRGIDVTRFDQQHNAAPRARRKRCKLLGGEVSAPSLPPMHVIIEEKKQLIASGELSIGEPCAPYKLTKSIVTSEGDIEMRSVEICGRKIPLTELRSDLLKKQELYMRLSTTTDIQNMNREQIINYLASVHHNISDGASLEQLQSEVATLQHTRTIAIWHDHSTILQTGYILFATWVIYDPAVFFTEDEYTAKTGININNLQAIIEEPAIYMIAPSSSSPTDQLALVSDRLECLQELSQPSLASNSVEITDRLRFFCGDKPAQQFERGTQLGGTYKCGGCGVKDIMMQDLANTLQHKQKSLADLQCLILAGKYGNAPGCLKPLEGLKVQELREELEARGQNTEGKLKQQLQSELVSILEGAQRVPTLLTLNPTRSLANLNLEDYEVLDCEPLHDIKGHLHNLLPEIPHLLPSSLKRECQLILDTTLPKGKVTGSLLRVAAIKILLKLRRQQVDPMIVMLMETVVRMSEILYSRDSRRSPKMILRLYNCSWLHHELCCHFLSTPKLQLRSHMFGAYLHDLVVHAPPQYQLVCLRSTNAESQERLFSKAKHISLKATSRKPENVLPTILISIQAQQKIGNCQQSIKKQESMVTSAASPMQQFQGTFISRSFLTNRLPSWQAHLQRISTYLVHGKDVWWKQEEEGYKFLDSESDPDFHSAGPSLMHFRKTNLPTVHTHIAQAWNAILSSNTILPTPSIRLYDSEGNYMGNKDYQETPVVPDRPTMELTTQISPNGPTMELTTPVVPHGPTTVLSTPMLPNGPTMELTAPVVPHGPTTVLSTPMLPNGPTMELTTPVVPHGPTTVLSTPMLPNGLTMEPTTPVVPHGPTTVLSTPMLPSGPTMEPTTPVVSHSPTTVLSTPMLPNGPTMEPTTPVVPHGPTPVVPHGPTTEPTTPVVHSLALVSNSLGTQVSQSAAVTLSTPSQLVYQLQPVALFDTCTSPATITTLNSTEVNSPCSSVTPAHLASSLDGHPQTPQSPAEKSTEDDVIIQCTLDHFHTDDDLVVFHNTLKTKAAKLVHKAIGLSSNLSRFDTLRAKLKANKLKKQKPTSTEKEEYTKLSAQLHTTVLSVKYTSRDSIKAFEKHYHQTHGTFPDCTNAEYQQLRKKLDFAKSSVDYGITTLKLYRTIRYSFFYEIRVHHPVLL